MKGLATAIAVLLAIFGPPELVAWEMGARSDFWEREANYYKDRHDYYFAGLNARGMLDTCERADGMIEIVFKGDCHQ